MAQILIMGASTAYGVGGPHGGWADMIKLQLHEEMYGNETMTEAHEVHIFAKPDATVQFILDTYEHYIADYHRDNRKTIVVLSIGMNDTKAIDRPDNYINTPQSYTDSMISLLNSLGSVTDSVLCIGFSPVDEVRTSPKLNPFTGKYSYFSNERIQKFNLALKEAVDASTANSIYIDLTERVKNGWIEGCLSVDGLHPNDDGHRRIFNAIMPEIKRLLSS